MKRVYCLYRVSTAQQVDVVKDDIQMQRIACHDFAARMGWTILVEKEEKGISGFKVPKQVLLCRYRTAECSTEFPATGRNASDGKCDLQRAFRSGAFGGCRRGGNN